MPYSGSMSMRTPSYGAANTSCTVPSSKSSSHWRVTWGWILYRRVSKRINGLGLDVTAWRHEWRHLWRSVLHPRRRSPRRSWRKLWRFPQTMRAWTRIIWIMVFTARSKMSSCSSGWTGRKIYYSHSSWFCPLNCANAHCQGFQPCAIWSSTSCQFQQSLHRRWPTPSSMSCICLCNFFLPHSHFPVWYVL